MKYINISDIMNASDRQHIIESNYDKKSLDITIEYPAIFSSAKVLRDFIVNISDFFNLKTTWRSRLTLIADELNNNGIEYGSKEGDINKLRIKVHLEDDGVCFTLEVEDTGRGTHAKSAKEMEELKHQKEHYLFEDHKSIRGRGLFLIISKIADGLYFKDSLSGGLIVGIQKKVGIEK